MNLVTVLTLPKFLSVRHALFDVVQDLECVVQLSDENHNSLIMKENLTVFLPLYSFCYLSKKKLSDCLYHSVPLDCLNLRPTSSVSESTQYLPTQNGDLERFNYDDEFSSVMPNFDLGILKRNPSLDSNDFFGDLSSEFEVKSVQSALSDLKRPPERLQSQCNYRLFIT